ncbi:hypothetical protein VC116059_003217B, partial [Vibrio cholerae O1 str. 116059]
PLSRGGYGCCV